MESKLNYIYSQNTWGIGDLENGSKSNLMDHPYVSYILEGNTKFWTRVACTVDYVLDFDVTKLKFDISLKFVTFEGVKNPN